MEGTVFFIHLITGEVMDFTGESWEVSLMRDGWYIMDTDTGETYMIPLGNILYARMIKKNGESGDKVVPFMNLVKGDDDGGTQHESDD